MQPNTTAREGGKETPLPIIDETTFMAAWRGQLCAVIGKPWLLRLWLDRSRLIVQRVARHYEHLRQQPRHIRRRLQRHLGVSLAGAALALALVNSPTQAATISVDGGCTLVDAITAANTDTATGGCSAGSGADTINLLNDVTLNSINNNGAPYGRNGLPVIISEITIEGANHTISRAIGAPEFRIFDVDITGSLTLNQTTITGGDAGIGDGGAIRNIGVLTVTNSTFTGNYAIDGGAISSGLPNNIAASSNANDTPAVSNSGLGGNTIHNSSALLPSIPAARADVGIGASTVTNSTFSGNSAKYDGGAIANIGLLTVTNSTFSGNSAEDGGAIANGYFGDLTLNNCTLTGNQANDSNPQFPNGSGGGIYSEGLLTLDRSLISGNTASNGAEVMQYVDQPLVASSSKRIDSLLAVTSSSNLFGHDGVSGVEGFTPDASDIVPDAGLNAILNPALVNNGGPTLTHALIDGSPALDAAGDSGLASDQRGVRRPQGAADDIGAFELERCDEVTITIVKESIPPSPTNFRFTSAILASGNRCQDTGSSINDFYLDNPTRNDDFNGENGGGDDGDAYSSSKSFIRQRDEVLSFSEPAVSGWHLMEITCDPAELATVNLATRSVTVRGEVDVTCTFHNARAAALTVRKYRESNGAPGQQAPEPFLSSWTIRVRTLPNDALVAQATTNALGKAAFTLKPGGYKVCEVQKIGWNQMVPNPADNACYNLELAPGSATQIDFGNCLTRSCPTMAPPSVNPGESDTAGKPVTVAVAVDALDAWVEQWLATPDGPVEQTLEPDVSDDGDAAQRVFLPVVVK